MSFVKKVSLFLLLAQMSAVPYNASAFDRRWGPPRGGHHHGGIGPIGAGIIGLGVGVLIGRHIAREDQQRAEEAHARAMRGREGYIERWQNPATGAYGDYVIRRVYFWNSSECREYVSHYWLNGQPRHQLVQSCWINGMWQTVSIQDYVEAPVVIPAPVPAPVPVLDGDAQGVCLRKFSHDSNKTECLQFVQQHRFDSGAVIECGIRFFFDSERMQCMQAIADKAYEYREVVNCINEPSASSKLRCFAYSGRPVVQVVPAPVPVPPPAPIYAPAPAPQPEPAPAPMPYRFPGNTQEFCNQEFGTDQMKITCIIMTKDHKYDQGALDDCRKRPQETDKMQCLKEIEDQY